MARVIRRHARVLPWVRAVTATAGMAWALGSMSFSPAAVGWLAAAVTGALMLGPSVAAVLTGVAAMSIPLAAASLAFGVAFLIAGALAAGFLARDHGGVFLIILASVLGVVAGPAWAAAVLAGYLYGASTGAAAAVSACVVIELAGLLTGVDSLGVLVTGGLPPAFLNFGALPEPLLAFGWVSDGIASAGDDAQALLNTLSTAGDVPLLVLQPLFWGAGAAVAGSLRCTAGAKHSLAKSAAAVTVGVLVAGGGSLAATALMATAEPGTPATVALAGSLAVALGVVALTELVFSRYVVVEPGAAAQSTMRAEDAEVDELLRLISEAEDELSTKHTTQAVVMITDMKSFSAMTEEEGSYTSAKLVQRHRDLLLPVIEAHKGSGKSTGGDGLVAAFDSPKRAVKAAIEMQKTLERYNAGHGDERDILVRVGIASGEVVLDSGGRPFIGTGLNLAARVMNLGDGGCIMVTRPVADGSKQTCLHSHGEFSLKNIAEPVEVIEVLWSDTRPPTPPPRK